MSSQKKALSSRDRLVVSYEQHHRVLKQLQQERALRRKCEQSTALPGASLAQYPNIPALALPALNDLFSDSANQVGRYFRRLFQRALFPNDVAMETSELDQLSLVWALMEVLLDAPRQVEDELEEMHVRVN